MQYCLDCSKCSSSGRACSINRFSLPQSNNRSYMSTGVKIDFKKCQGSFGPFISHFWGPSQSFKGLNFLFSLIRPMPILLSPQNMRALRARQVLIVRAACKLAEGRPYFNPCTSIFKEIFNPHALIWFYMYICFTSSVFIVIWLLGIFF